MLATDARCFGKRMEPKRFGTGLRNMHRWVAAWWDDQIADIS